MENSPNIIFRQYTKGDETQIVELYNLVFSRSRTIQEWSWIFENNPAGAPLITVASHNARIIGVYNLIPYKAKYRDKEAIAYQLVDIMVHPEYRGTGLIFRKLKQFAHHAGIAEITGARYVFAYGFLNDGLALLGKYQLADYIPRYVKVLDSSALTYRFPKRLLSNALISLLARWLVRLLIFFTKTADRSFDIIRAYSFGEEMDLFWDNVKKDYCIATIRNSEYLNWRYLKVPESFLRQAHNDNSSYEVFIIKKGGTILGYAVLKCKDKKGILVDFLTQRDKKTIRIFLSFISDYFKAKGMNIVIFYATDRHLKNNLFLSGFLKAGKSPLRLATGSYSPGISDEMILDINNWYLTYADVAEF